MYSCMNISNHKDIFSEPVHEEFIIYRLNTSSSAWLYCNIIFKNPKVKSQLFKTPKLRLKTPGSGYRCSEPTPYLVGEKTSPLPWSRRDYPSSRQVTLWQVDTFSPRTRNIFAYILRLSSYSSILTRMKWP